MFLFFLIVVLIYIKLALIFTFLVHRLPRNPIADVPDWGNIEDHRIPTVGGGMLEVWRVTPDLEPGEASRGTVVLAHGWGRNRGRMVGRARAFAEMGFSTILHSARDHGSSTKKLMMNAVGFGEDIESVLRWAGAEKEPVLLYGHSAGSGGSAIAASRHPTWIKALFLEGSFPDVREARLSLYRWFHPLFGYLFGPAIVFFAKLYFGISWQAIAPANLAKNISCPVMIIHGARDRRFPVSFAPRLRDAFKHVPTAMFLAPNSGHSDSSLDPDFIPSVRRFLQTNGFDIRN